MAASRTRAVVPPGLGQRAPRRRRPPAGLAIINTINSPRRRVPSRAHRCTRERMAAALPDVHGLAAACLACGSRPGRPQRWTGQKRRVPCCVRARRLRTSGALGPRFPLVHARGRVRGGPEPVASREWRSVPLSRPPSILPVLLPVFHLLRHLSFFAETRTPAFVGSSFKPDTEPQELDGLLQLSRSKRARFCMCMVL